MTSCGEAMIELLERAGSTTVFGIPGVHTLELYRGLTESGIRHVTPRHEQGAGFMADGYARVAGRPGVCLLITGPGVTNVAHPDRPGLPRLDPDAGDLRRQSPRLAARAVGACTTCPTSRACRGVTAFSHSRHATRPSCPTVLARAFDDLRLGAGRGPVHIEIPLDVLTRCRRRRDRGRPPRPPAARSPTRRPSTRRRRCWPARGAPAHRARRRRRRRGDAALALGRAPRRAGRPHDQRPRATAPDASAVPRRGLTLRARRRRLRDADVVLAVGTELSRDRALGA